MKHKLTQKRLKQLLHYNPQTGLFRWRSDGRRYKFADIAGCKASEYVLIGIDGCSYGAHRLVWLYVYGFLPENQIDHINRNPRDNRLINLREVSRQCNARNCNISSNNTSGVTGISLTKNKKKWYARIKVNRKEIYLGSFEDFDMAVLARWYAEKKYNFPDCNSYSSAYVYIMNNNIQSV